MVCGSLHVCTVADGSTLRLLWVSMFLDNIRAVLASRLLYFQVIHVFFIGEIRRLRKYLWAVRSQAPPEVQSDRSP